MGYSRCDRFFHPKNDECTRMRCWRNGDDPGPIRNKIKKRHIPRRIRSILFHPNKYINENPFELNSHLYLISSPARNAVHRINCFVDGKRMSQFMLLPLNSNKQRQQIVFGRWQMNWNRNRAEEEKKSERNFVKSKFYTNQRTASLYCHRNIQQINSVLWESLQFIPPHK